MRRAMASNTETPYPFKRVVHQAGKASARMCACQALSQTGWHARQAPTRLRAALRGQTQAPAQRAHTL